MRVTRGINYVFLFFLLEFDAIIVQTESNINLLTEKGGLFVENVF